MAMTSGERPLKGEEKREEVDASMPVSILKLIRKWPKGYRSEFVLWSLGDGSALPAALSWNEKRKRVSLSLSPNVIEDIELGGERKKTERLVQRMVAGLAQKYGIEDVLAALEADLGARDRLRYLVGILRLAFQEESWQGHKRNVKVWDSKPAKPL